MTLKLIRHGEVQNLKDEDLNTITKTGAYHQNLSSSASLDLNYPEQIAGLLEVQNPANHDMVYQRFTAFNSGRMYYRGAYRSSWGQWKKVLTE